MTLFRSCVIRHLFWIVQWWGMQCKVFGRQKLFPTLFEGLNERREVIYEA